MYGRAGGVYLLPAACCAACPCAPCCGCTAWCSRCPTGLQGLSFPAEYGGQGLPLSVAILKSEMMATANWTWGMYPGLSKGCINTLLAHGSDQLKKDYLPELVEGKWTGTMRSPSCSACESARMFHACVRACVREYA